MSHQIFLSRTSSCYCTLYMLLYYCILNSGDWNVTLTWTDASDDWTLSSLSCSSILTLLVSASFSFRRFTSSAQTRTYCWSHRCQRSCQPQLPRNICAVKWYTAIQVLTTWDVKASVIQFSSKAPTCEVFHFLRPLLQQPGQLSLLCFKLILGLTLLQLRTNKPNCSKGFVKPFISFITKIFI